MGKGDRRTKRGKRWRSAFGKYRMRPQKQRRKKRKVTQQKANA